jgi:hypothetical protein
VLHLAAALRQRPLNLHISSSSNHELGLCSALAAPGVELSLHETFSHRREAMVPPCWVTSWSNEQLSHIVKLHLHSTATPTRVDVLPLLDNCKSLAIDNFTDPNPSGAPDWVLPPSLERLSINPTSLEQVAMPWPASLRAVTVEQPNAFIDASDAMFERLGQLPPGCALELVGYDVGDHTADVVHLGQLKNFLTKVDIYFWDMSPVLAAALAASVMPDTALDIWCGVRGAGCGVRGAGCVPATSTYRLFRLTFFTIIFSCASIETA